MGQLIRTSHFKNPMIFKYRQLIQKALVECENEQKTSLDIGKLYIKLQVIHRMAQQEGLAQDVLDQLISEAVPNLMPRAA